MLASIYDGIGDHRTVQLLQIEGIFYRASEFARLRAAA